MGLSVGTVVTRALAAVSQLLLAIWLAPADFGAWAAATSLISLLTGLANFGEVNGYLSGKGGSYDRVKRVTRRQNSLLALLGLGLAAIYFVRGEQEVGWLAVIVTLTIPLVGDAERMYSTGVKIRAYGTVVSAQAAAALVKIGVGVLIAALGGGSFSLAVSTLLFYLVMDVFVTSAIRNRMEPGGPELDNIDRRDRFKWAVNSLFITLPLQAGFLVAQFVTSAHVLGLYYFAYQVTTGISGLISVPLSRVTLSRFAELAGTHRGREARRIATIFGGATLLAAAAMALVLPELRPFLGSTWIDAVPAVILLSASLPARMMTPVMDALQQSRDRWWQSTGFNAVDAAGTAAAALTAATGDVLILAASLSVWKIALGLTRMWVVLRDQPVGPRIALTVPVSVGALLVMSSQFIPRDAAAIAAMSAGLLSVVWVATQFGKRSTGAASES
ncbi:oligosaccharide flippase family protein [Curtobacterium sp. VKM Ac-1376]|uniref:oligosaccharide flippase family protein n=1 Tax=Curtobacterium sp. VKM Ac-1376 TaxID=123312 RepID=UPI00188BA00D|nr:oligosaccharide flippase family protein [Curtobacterium sp. VKM Ac-1376]MBF4614146.1 oligosaccharide flippase family protein [Curtobacterium sp. VKM Ac-1376]